MSEYRCFLIWVLYGDTLLECALKVHRKHLPGDMEECPMEPENREKFHAMLPLHVQSCGPIVKIESIFEVHEVPE